MTREIHKKRCTLIPEVRQIDVNNVGSFGQELMESLKEPYQYILDLQNISFIDSSGLGSLIAALRFVNDSGRKMVLCSPSPAVELLFKMVRLSQISSICKSRQDAEELLAAEE